MARTLILASLAFLAYTYAGYPILIFVWARLRPRTVRKTWLPFPPPRVSILVAAHDEAAHIGAKLASCLEQDYPPEALEIIVVSDASTDTTDRLVRAHARRHPNVRLVRQAPRAGKPTALNLAAAHATGEIFVFTDARQELSPGAVRALVACLGDPTVGVAGGEYVLEPAPGPGGDEAETASSLYWRYEKALRVAESQAGSTLGVSGALYAIRRDDFVPLPPQTLLDDMLVPLRVHLASTPLGGRPGRRIVIEPTARAYDEAPDTATELSRKVRTLAGNYQLLGLFPALLLPWRNPSFFQFVSHKLCRLLAPWALVVAFVASLVSTTPLATAALLVQVMLYAFALLGAHESGGRLGRLCHAFVVLHAAALLGLWRLLRARQPVAWKQGVAAPPGGHAGSEASSR